MSQKQQVLHETGKFILAVIIAVMFGPWLILLGLAWLLEPRTGGWGAWPHIVGLGWLALIVFAIAFEWLRPR